MTSLSEAGADQGVADGADAADQTASAASEQVGGQDVAADAQEAAPAADVVTGNEPVTDQPVAQEGEAVGEQVTEEASESADGSEPESLVGDAAHVTDVSPIDAWINSTLFPATVTVRNHGGTAKTEPVTASYIGAGSAVLLTLISPEHASAVIDNLATINDTGIGSAGLVVDELPFALTKKG